MNTNSIANLNVLGSKSSASVNDLFSSQTATSGEAFATLLQTKLNAEQEITQASAVNAGRSPMDLLNSLAPASFMPLESSEISLEISGDAVGDSLQEKPESAQEALQQFVGETFYGIMMKQMRSSVMKSDLFGNSSALNMFESQFDQMMVEKMAANSTDQFSQPMYEQMTRLGRAH